jgi:ribosomal-protein-serine acetyltransferase
MLSFRLDNAKTLRLLEEADAGELNDLVEANRDHLARWLPWAPSQTFDDTLEFIRRTRRQLAENDGFQTAIVDERERIIGVVGFHQVSWAHRSTSIGYWLAADAQRYGTMTVAVSALVAHAIATWKLHRVEIRAAVENRRSRAIPERLGFVEEGTIRGAERVGDRYLDLVVYSIISGRAGP